MASMEREKDKSKLHKLSLKGSAKLVAEFFQYSIHTILFQRGVYPAEDFTAVKKYGLNMLVSADDQVKAYIKKIMSQLDRWMVGGKISKLVIVITNKDTSEHIERWEFNVQILPSSRSSKGKNGGRGLDQENIAPEYYLSSQPIRSWPEFLPGQSGTANGFILRSSSATNLKPEVAAEKSEAEIQAEIAAIFRQITASVTFLPQLQGDCTFNVLVYADADSEVPVEWGDSDAKEIEGGERVQLRGFSTSSHRVETLVSYRLGE